MPASGSLWATAPIFLRHMWFVTPAGYAGISFGGYGWAPTVSGEACFASKSCKLTLPEAPFVRQRAEGAEG